MEILQSALQTVNSVPGDAWTLIIEILVAALITSPVVLGIKKWWHVHSDKIMLAITIGASLLAGVVLYLQNDPELAPWFALVQGWLIFATTQPVYRYFIKGLFARLGVWFNEKVEEAARYNAEVLAAKNPVVDEDFGV
jgi:hypothetical protein